MEHKRRDRLHILAEILSIAKDGSLKTKIMYKANLSFAQLNEYLSFLLKMNLLQANTDKGKKVYQTTVKGAKYLESYRELSALLNGDISPHRNSQLLLPPQ